MKRLKLVIVAVAALSLLSGSAASADGFAPGEGLYVGAFAASSMGMVRPSVQTNPDAGYGATGGTYSLDDGGIGLTGMEGGGWLGYGYRMGDVYAGLEGEMSAGDVEFKISASPGIHLTGGPAGSNIATCDSGICGGDADATTLSEIKATKQWTGGMFGRFGVYVNPNTLLSVRGGVLVSKFEVSMTGVGTNMTNSEDYYGGGPSFGVSLESTVAAIDPNLNVRVGAVYTDYLTAEFHDIGTAVSGSQTLGEVTGDSLSARIGLTYSFFDVNSLF